MTKRLTAILICMAMLMTMLPSSALAARPGGSGQGGSGQGGTGTVYGSNLGWYYANIVENRNSSGTLTGYDVTDPAGAGDDYSAIVHVSYEVGGVTTSWTEGSATADILSSSSTAQIHITCDFGYYISYIVLCCDDRQDDPFGCQTVGTEDAYGLATSDSVPTSVTLNIADLYEKANHASGTETYYLMVMVEEVPPSAYVGYDSGAINGVELDAIPVDISQTVAGSDGWATYNGETWPTLIYSRGETDYAHHSLLGISAEAEAKANDKGYSFAGWKLDYFHEYEISTNTFSNELSIGDDRLPEGTDITIYTHALLTAIWQPMASISIFKEWIDADDQDGLRPETLTVYLRATSPDGSYTVRQIVLTAEGNWQTTLNVPMYDTDGNELTYSLTEEAIDGYSGSISSAYNDTVLTFTAVNTHSTLTTTVNVLKSWQDSDDRDGIRPDSVTVQLYANDVAVGDPITLSDDNLWLYSWTDLPQYEAGVEITYTVKELNVPDGYESNIQSDAYTGILTVVNTHEPAKTQISVSKAWNDADDQDGIRPASVTVELYADNVATGVTAVLSAENNWSYTFADLLKNFNGSAISYSVKEVNTAEGYTSAVTGDMTNGFTITNTHEPEKTQVAVSKVWDDANNQDGIRPVSVTVSLLANGTATGQTLVLNANNNWTGVFADLAKFSDGEAIEYTVVEAAVEGYTTSYSGNSEDGFVITNSHTPKLLDLRVVKIWDDADNQDGIRPASVTVYLLQNGVKLDDPIVLSEANQWSGIWEDLPAYLGGVKVTYTVSEVQIDGYATTFEDVEDGIFHITNTYSPATTAVTVQKEWRDNNNQDGIRPDSVTIELYAGGVATGKTITLSASNNWKASFTDLAKYDDGALIEYTVVETNVPDGYTAAVSVDSDTGIHLVVNTHVPETVDVPVNKIWVDNNDQDGIRPDSITVELYADGIATGKTLTLTADGSWSGVFEDVDKYSYGTEVVYSVEEVNVPAGYTATHSGTTITNTHIPETIRISAQKVWNDGDNQDGLRPTALTINLYANGVLVATKEMNVGNLGYIEFNDLPKYENGQLIEYTIEEVDVPSGYSVSYSGSAADGFIITNTHTPEKTELSVEKVWDDNDNQDGKRPASVTVHLLAGGEHTGQTQVLSAENNWTAQWTDLDVYRNGVKINYTVYETPVEGYSASYTRDASNDRHIIITNAYTPQTTSVTVQKVWADNSNQDGIRPGSIDVKLYADGKEVASVTLTADNHWKYTFSGLAKYSGGVEIVYTVKETAAVSGYTTTYRTDEYTGILEIVNTHEPEKTQVSVSKVWNDADDQDGIRPGSVTVELCADGIPTGKTLVLNADNNWSGVFADVDKFSSGTEVIYSVLEVSVPDGYSVSYSGSVENGFTVTNTHVPEKTEITVTKNWNDNNNQDGIRPMTITVNVYGNDQLVATIELTAENNWKYTLSGLDKYAGGKEIVYTVDELAIDGYEGVYDGLTITNTHVPASTQISVSKVWNDADDQDGKRPDSVTVHLLANGEHTGYKQVLSAENSWAYTWEDLPMYQSGALINYTVYEEAVEGYVTGYARDENDHSHVIITNTYAPQKTSLTVLKVWEDGNNQDGLRPGSVQIELYANDKATGIIVTLNQDNHWSYTFTDLNKMENGQPILYTAVELTEDDNYAVSYRQDAESGVYEIVNTHIPATTAIQVRKVWDDNNNQDGIRPDSIIVQLFADGVYSGLSLELSADNNWSGSFTDLPVNSYGTPVIYTIEEVARGGIPGYTGSVAYPDSNTIVVTNTHTPEITEFPVIKIWNDGDNRDGIRPSSVTVALFADGVDTGLRLILSADNEWSGKFADLPKYADGAQIAYTVRELDIPEGYSADINGGTITNSYTPGTTSLSVSKVWDDSNNQDGVRPDSITVHLLANGEHTGMTVILNDENGWTAQWTDLPEKHNGVIIQYTVWEESVSSYTAVYNREGSHVIITNSHLPETTVVSVEKLWDDAANRDQIRPDKVLIVLCANNVRTEQVLVLSHDNNWFGQWTDLPKYEGGKEIAYSVEEIDITPGYTFTVREDSENRNWFIVTNHHTAATTQVTVTKRWLDSNNYKGLRPASVEIALYGNGQRIGHLATLSESNNWSYTWTDLYLNENGKPIEYTVVELNVPEGYEVGYTPEINADGTAHWTVLNMLERNTGTIPTEPPTEPTEPPTQPTEPPTEPTEPPTEPTEPPTEPTEPPTQPTEPPTEPTEPPTQPTEPPTEPTEPPTQPTEPTDPTDPEGPPKLGSSMDLYFLLMIVSMAGVLVLSVIGRKRTEEA